MNTHFQKELQPAKWKQELPTPPIMDPEDEIAKLREQLTVMRGILDAQERRHILLTVIPKLTYWRDIAECDCGLMIPQGGCLRCDLDDILKAIKRSHAIP